VGSSAKMDRADAVKNVGTIAGRRRSAESGLARVLLLGHFLARGSSSPTWRRPRGEDAVGLCVVSPRFRGSSAYFMMFKEMNET